MRSCEESDEFHSLQRDGFVVLRRLYSPGQVEWARGLVTDNLSLFKNTRPNPSAGHLAGFHRHPELEVLHTWVSAHPQILSVLRNSAGRETIRSIGLSDITVNRSQAWHVDLLRGRYRHHLDALMCWGPDGGGVYKALVYLQAGKSLKVVPGEHLLPRSLESDLASEPVDESRVETICVQAGDVILMDIRLPHCGSSETDLADSAFFEHQKILVSTVLGDHRKPLTKAMELGNLERLLDWETAHA